MRVTVITPPEAVVSWAEADAHLRLSGYTAEQAFVEGLVAAVTGHLDGPDGWLGRALGAQTLEAKLDSFAAMDGLRLPYPPLIDVASIKYLDSSGDEQTADPSSYEIRGDRIGLAYGQSWPTPLDHPESVRVRYRAGYVANPEADPLVNALPAAIRAAILLMVSDLFENRGSVVTGTIASEIPMQGAVRNLLGPYQIWPS